jgi:hypothetical protein
MNGCLLASVVFDKRIDEQTVEELQVDVVVKVVAVDAFDHLQRTLDNGNLDFRADFEKVEPVVDIWGEVNAEPRLIGLCGWGGRAVVLYIRPDDDTIRPDDDTDRLRIELH